MSAGLPVRERQLLNLFLVFPYQRPDHARVAISRGEQESKSAKGEIARGRERERARRLRDRGSEKRE
jgi:hypothetical protein